MQFQNDIDFLLILLIIPIILVFLLLFWKRIKRKKKRKELSPELLSERKKFYHALIFPCFFLFLLWFVKFIEFGLQADFAHLGIYPGEWKGLTGIITAPLIHADIKHLIDNSVPVVVLSVAIFYFYREISYKIFFIIYFVTGFLVWIAGREAYHIGASGLIYGFAAFLFLSGILRKNTNLLAISLLVIFLYGSLIWGILPYDYTISWESHLMGGLTGFVMAIIYKNEGPPRQKYSWEDEDENEEGDEQSTDHSLRS
jgi:membrane associated rhomboid family serine protease